MEGRKGDEETQDKRGNKREAKQNAVGKIDVRMGKGKYKVMSIVHHYVYTKTCKELLRKV